MRNGSTIAFGLALWAAYTRAILLHTTSGERIVTHYQRYLADPVAEVARIASHVGVTPTDAQRDDVRAFVRHDRRHSRFTAGDLRDVNVSATVSRLYRDLCVEADAAEEGTGERGVWPAFDGGGSEDAADVPGQFDYDAMERLRRSQV
jgi:hypothetical protein